MTQPTLLPTKVQLSVFVFPLLFLCFAYSTYLFDTATYNMLFGILEAGFFEWVQFICYGLASCIGLKSFLAYRNNSPQAIQKYVLLLFAVGCAFIALEEVSYGQHIFKWRTPGKIANINSQKETNLHNLAVIQGNNLQLIAYIAVGWLGGLAWIFRRKHKNLSLPDLVFPHWYLSSYFLPLAIFYTRLWYTLGFGNKHQETFETILSFGFVGIAIVNLLKVKGIAKATPLWPSHRLVVDRLSYGRKSRRRPCSPRYANHASFHNQSSSSLSEYFGYVTRRRRKRVEHGSNLTQEQRNCREELDASYARLRPPRLSRLRIN